MKPEELKTILDDHVKWLLGEGGKRANLTGADLCWAKLGGADLCGANLGGADLCGANLRGADLGGANLRGANLGGANLSGADLGGADLGGANLTGANLSGAKIDASICRMDFGGWSICVYANRTIIGCQSHANESWLDWTPDCEEIKKMHRDASAWWATHGESVKAVIKCVMAKSAKRGEA